MAELNLDSPLQFIKGVGPRKAEVMMLMTPRDASSCDGLQFLMLRGRSHHKRRVDLLKHIAVLLEDQPEVLPQVVGY